MKNKIQCSCCGCYLNPHKVEYYLEAPYCKPCYKVRLKLDPNVSLSVRLSMQFPVGKKPNKKSKKRRQSWRKGWK